MDHMCTVRHLVAWLIVLGTPAAQGAEPVSASNWRRHPDIAEIRAIYREIKRAETAGRLRNLRRDCGSHDKRTLYLDARGAVRSYYFAGASDDSGSQHAYYYDGSGRLRFVFMKAEAPWVGSKFERRIYLSKDGKRLWDEKKHKGLGYTFPKTGLVNNPEQDFHEECSCQQ
jgi:YD repeat-containing protein